MGANTDRAVEQYFRNIRRWDLYVEEGISYTETEKYLRTFSLLTKEERIKFFDRTRI